MEVEVKALKDAIYHVELSATDAEPEDLVAQITRKGGQTPFSYSIQLLRK